MRMVPLVNFQDELKKRTEEIEKVLASYLPKEEGFARTMAQAMNYSVKAEANAPPHDDPGNPSDVRRG